MKTYSISMHKIHILISILLITGLSSCSTQKQAVKNERFSGLIQQEITNVDADVGYELDESQLNFLARDMVIQGSKLQLQNKHAEAIIEFLEAKRYDSSSAINYFIASSFKALGKYETAKDYIMQTLESNEEYIPAIDLLLSIYISQTDLENAVITQERLMELDPSRARTFTYARLLEFKDPHKSVEVYEKLNEEIEEYGILLRLYELYKNSGKDEEFLGVVQKLHKYKPTDYALSFSILEENCKTSQYDKALEALDLIYDNLKEEEIEYCYTYAGNYFYLDTNKAVEKHIEEYLDRIDRNFYFNWRINILSGYLAWKLQDTLGKEKYFTRALKIADTIADVPMQIAVFNFDTRQYEEAIDILDQYSREFPEDVRFPYLGAMAYTLLDNIPSALDKLHLAFGLDSSNTEVLGQIGFSYDKLGIYDSSDYFYEKALTINPEDPLLNNNYAYSLSCRDLQLERCLEMSQIAVDALPDNASYLDTYGWINFKLGDLEIAKEYLMRAIATGDINAELYEHLGEIYLEMGDPKNALDSFRKGLEYECDNEKLKKRIKELENK
jgi:tetratricopeptide (TPR) repeat protein